MGFQKRGQSAIELVIIVGFVTFFFAIFLLVLNYNLADEEKENKNLLLKEVALNVQQEISLAHESIDGYTRNFTLPPRIFGADYFVDIEGTSVYVRTVDEEYALSLPVLVVTGNVQIGVNVIRKIEGVVYLNQ